jgi:hypothetical protein
VTLLFAFTGLLLGAQVLTIGVLVFDGWRARRNERAALPESASTPRSAAWLGVNTTTELEHQNQTGERHSRVAA